MELKQAKKVIAEMHKQFTGEWYDALQTLGGYMGHVADITREMDFGPDGFGDSEIMKDIQKAWPKDR